MASISQRALNLAYAGCAPQDIAQFLGQSETTVLGYLADLTVDGASQEQRILSFVRAGHHADEIAVWMGVSVSTVFSAIADTGTDPSAAWLPPSVANVVEHVNTVATSGASQTLPDVLTDTLHRIVLSAACTLTLPTPGAGKSLTVVTVQNGTGGWAITWATPSGAIKWPGGAAPTYTTTAAAVDVTTFLCADGTNWLGFPAGYDLR